MPIIRDIDTDNFTYELTFWFEGDEEREAEVEFSFTIIGEFPRTEVTIDSFKVIYTAPGDRLPFTTWLEGMLLDLDFNGRLQKAIHTWYDWRLWPGEGETGEDLDRDTDDYYDHTVRDHPWPL